MKQKLKKQSARLTTFADVLASLRRLFRPQSPIELRMFLCGSNRCHTQGATVITALPCLASLTCCSGEDPL